MTGIRPPAVLLALALVLAGCSDAPAGARPAGTASPGTASPAAASPGAAAAVDVDEVVGGVRFAFLGAETVHLKGTVGDGSTNYRIDLRQRKGGDAAGSIVVGDQEASIIKIGSTLWLSGNGPFLEEVGGEGASDFLRGKWLKVGKDDMNLGAFAVFTDRAELARAFLSTDYTEGEPAELRGEPAVRLTDEDGGVLWVTPGDRNLPLRLEGPPTEGALDFLEYDAPVDIKAPPASKVVEAP